LSHLDESHAEKEDDYFFRQKELQTTTKAQRRQGQVTKKGKPPIQKTNTTVVKCPKGDQSAIVRTNETGLAQPSLSTQLDKIFAKQKKAMVKRCGSTKIQ